jgi:hypothetical protein
VAALLALALAALPAAADPDADRERAVELFRACREQKEAGQLEAACRNCQESYDLSHSIGPLVNLADCEEARGRIATAYAQWQAALATMPPDDQRVEIARAHILALERRLPKVHLAWPAVSQAAIWVEVDGRREPGRPETVLLDPGTHEIAMVAHGHEPRRHRLELAEGAEQTLVVAVGPALAVAPPLPPPPPGGDEDPGEGQRVAAYVVGSIGIAATIGFVVTGALALDRQSTVDDLCDADTRLCTDAEGVDAAEEGGRLEIANAVMLAVAAAGIGTALVLYFTAPSGEDVAVRVGPLGVGLDGRF